MESKWVIESIKTKSMENGKMLVQEYFKKNE